MKVQLDTTALRRELHKVIYDDKACAQWVRDFEYTLGCWGTNENPHPFAMELIVEAEGYRATQSFKKMRAAVIKELGSNASSEDVNKRLVEKYGEKRVKDICDAIHRANESSADGDTREDSQDVPDGSDASTLESATSADTKTTEPSKNSYGEFGNVKMTTAEFEKLVQAEGADRANALIEELSSYLASSGKRYKSHYATLLNWGRRKDKDGEPKQKFLTADDISRRNIEESKRQLDALMANRRAAHG